MRMKSLVFKLLPISFLTQPTSFPTVNCPVHPCTDPLTLEPSTKHPPPVSTWLSSEPPSFPLGVGGCMRVGGWMDGWMDGWTVGWLDGWMDGWLDFFEGAIIFQIFSVASLLLDSFKPLKLDPFQASMTTTTPLPFSTSPTSSTTATTTITITA